MGRKVIVEFSRKKLPKEASGDLRLCPIESVRPFAAMPAPVYVFLRANEKFVAVKGPLDYFTPEELQRLLPMESFFFPESVDQVSKFQEAGRRVRVLLSWSPDGEKSFEREMAPYEMSDAVIRILGPLWSSAGIESLFVCALALDLCGPLPGPTLEAVRDHDVLEYERRLISSSWVAFLALHLGYCDLSFLTKIRLAAFEGPAGTGLPGEIASLTKAVDNLLSANDHRALSIEGVKAIQGPIGPRLVSRLERIAEHLMDAAAEAPSVYGEKGFADG